MAEMKVEYVEPGKLKPYQRNAKRHPEEQVQHIANSIREFGFRQPIVVDADNVVVIGHGRLMAAKKLGLESVPVVRADDLTEEQIKALRLADNKTNESEWDFEELEAELADLEHPSMLPRHRGQDAVRWTVHMGDAITGGTVYELSDKCDGGDILAQEVLFVRPGWDYHKLWEALFPVGVRMIVDAVAAIGEGRATYTKQDESVATWEPSWERPRLRRNELIMLGGSVPGTRSAEGGECSGCRRDCRWCTYAISAEG